ncbi:terminase large subunit domain-containing protein [Microbacterium maritypicum]|uniref:Terminase large subunit-like ATPase domain-containing protein n=1 Tax=Microbacterium maritypicum MF109 TaxID=1333857 RepID=T5KLR8_MICMQ|nr:terminase large subunit [Microbacterium liquefaciens]EQM78204.1 hypothetical protein L687_16895 [Microbacterium maritypicum MF109]
MTPHLLKPARFTAPLSPDFPSLWDRYEKIIQIVWRVAFGYTLEPWQCWLLRHALEVYPKSHELAGKLRYRQVVVSIPRQSGKTEIAAALGLVALLREAKPLVIGIASTAQQASLVYNRTMEAINGNPSMKKKFDKLTEGRGIRSTTGGRYEIRAAKGSTLQGLPVSTGIVDEVHVLKSELWTALLKGMGGRHNTILVGITTAGAYEDSELLVNLYANGEKAMAGDPDFEQFGFFAWEAPESRVPTDRDELLEFLYACQPALASGRKSERAVLADLAGTPEPDVLRYDLNRFTASSNPYMPADRWMSCQRGEGYIWPAEGPLVFTFDQTPEDGYATVTAHRKTPDGRIHTELVAWLVHPTTEQLIRLAEKLWAHGPVMYAGDGYKLRPFLMELKKRNYPVWIGTATDAVNSASFLYSKVMQKGLVHGGEPLLSVQMPRAVRKQKGDVYRIDKTSSSVEIDAVIATALGAYVVEQQQERSVGVY